MMVVYCYFQPISTHSGSFAHTLRMRRLLAMLLLYPFRFAENVMSSMSTKLHSKSCFYTKYWSI